MADILNSKLLNNGAGILKKDACVVLVRTERNALVVDEPEKGSVASRVIKGKKRRSKQQTCRMYKDQKMTL